MLTKAAWRRIGDFNAQELANTAWALATADSPNAFLNAVLAKAARQLFADFNAQELDSTWQDGGASLNTLCLAFLNYGELHTSHQGASGTAGKSATSCCTTRR